MRGVHGISLEHRHHMRDIANRYILNLPPSFRQQMQRFKVEYLSNSVRSKRLKLIGNTPHGVYDN